MQFVSRIKGTRDIHTLTPDQFRQKTTEAREALQRGHPISSYTHQEIFAGKGVKVRPYYDWDANFELSTDGSGDDFAEQRKEHRNQFARAMGKLHPSSKILYAQRHGLVEKAGTKKYKISYRAFVCDAAMVVTDIPAHAKSILSEDELQYLDLSVYKEKQQLLGVIYGCKDIDTIKRYLVPLEEGEDPCQYLAQNVSPNAKEVLAPAKSAGMGRRKEEKKEGKKGSKKTRGIDGGEVEPGEGDGRKVMTRAECASALDAASDFFGEKFRMQEVLQKIIIDPSSRSLTFPTVRKWCYIRKATHAGNNPYITVTESGARFKCPDEECAAKAMQGSIPLDNLPKEIRDLFQIQIVSADKDHVLVGEARDICRSTIVDLFSDEKAENLQPYKAFGDGGDKTARFLTDLSHQKCYFCKKPMVMAEHSLDGICLRCKQCGKKWPKKGFITSLNPEDHSKLYMILNQWNVQQNVFVVNNNYGSAEDISVTGYEEDGLRIFSDDDALNRCFVRALQGTDSTLSDLAFMLYKDTFHCSQAGSKGTDGMFFQFRDHCWADKAELHLKKLLADDDFLGHFRRALRFYEHDTIQTEDAKKKARAIRKLIEQIMDGGRRKRILDDAIIRFHEYRPCFLEDLNTKNMLVFTNGVMDLDKFEFREGRPEDILSIKLPFHYQPQDTQSVECAYVLDFMRTIQPDEATRDYLLTVLSLCLSTDTSMQYFWILTGAGANGKSKLMNLISDTLGEHFGAAPAALLTRRREDANQANEALSQLQKARIAVFSEGSASEIIQVNTVKLFTGEDAISTRGLHEKQQRWRPFFKCFLVCNEIPKLDDSSWAGWRRFRVIAFEIKFVDEPRLPHERKKDPEVGKRLAACTGAFAGILVEYLRRFKANGLRESEKVMQATQAYQTDNDLVEEFRQERIVELKGAALKATDAYEQFEKWIVTKNRRKGLGRKAVIAMFDAKFGEPKSARGRPHPNTVRGWKGLALLGQVAEEVDGDASASDDASH